MLNREFELSLNKNAFTIKFKIIMKINHEHYKPIILFQVSYSYIILTLN